jgi:eukaryotic-like serine/threonine-protein kinase
MKNLLIALFLSACSAVAQESWPTWRGTADMRGLSPSELKFPLQQAWKVQLGKPVVATAVSDGTLVFIGDGNGKFAAYELATGKEKWQQTIKGPIEGSAGVSGDIVVYGAGDSAVHALQKSDGKELWKAPTDGDLKGAMNFYTAPDGNTLVLVGSYDNNLYAFDLKTGEKKWSVATSNYINGAAALAGNNVLFGGCDGFVYMVNAADGKETGKVEIRDNIASTVATDGKNAYLAHYGCSVLAIDLEKKVAAWTFKERDFPFVSSPAVTDDLIIAGDRGKTLWAIDKQTGDKKWSFRGTGKMDSSPVVTKNAVLVGSEAGFLYAVNLADGAEIWSAELGPGIQSSPCVVGSYVLVGDDGGNLHCYRSGQ